MGCGGGRRIGSEEFGKVPAGTWIMKHCTTNSQGAHINSLETNLLRFFINRNSVKILDVVILILLRLLYNSNPNAGPTTIVYEESDIVVRLSAVARFTLGAWCLFTKIDSIIEIRLLQISSD